MKQPFGIHVPQKVETFVKKYRLLFYFIAIGCVLLLLLSTGEPDHGIEGQFDPNSSEAVFSLDDFESELSKILSKISGAGEVSVMLTVSSGPEHIFATNRESSVSETEKELQEEMVVISTANGDAAVLVKQNFPVFLGALVVCPGGDDPDVILALTKALSSLTGLSSNRIAVCRSM